MVSRRVLLSLFAGVMLTATVGAQAPKPAMMRGQVTDKDRTPMAGVSVDVTDGTFDHTYSVSTGADGKFAVDDMPSGVYAMTVSSPGYRTVKVEHIDLTHSGALWGGGVTLYPER